MRKATNINRVAGTILSVAIMFGAPPFAQSEVICVPNSVKLRGNSLPLSGQFTTIAKCLRSEKAILDTEVLKGPKGETGATGAQGAKGETGPAGTQGPKGAREREDHKETLGALSLGSRSQPPRRWKQTWDT
jgi:hypothetical protein